MQKILTKIENYPARIAEHLESRGIYCAIKNGGNNYLINAIGSYSDVMNSNGIILNDLLEKKKINYKPIGFGDYIKPNCFTDSAQQTYKLKIGDDIITVQVSTKQLDIDSKRS